MVETEQGVSLTLAEFKALRTYSTSLPTGVIFGKRWKRREPHGGPIKMWWMGEYFHPEGAEDFVAQIRWTRITSVTP